MKVTYKKNVNIEKCSRVEFLLINYDYIDGNDYLAKLFNEEYGFSVGEELEPDTKRKRYITREIDQGIAYS